MDDTRLQKAAAAIAAVEAREADELAFVARVFVQATLPHSDPGNVAFFARTNGDVTLAVQPGYGAGVPYGVYPRLLLAWINTEVVRTRSRTLILGRSLSDFMRAVGVVPSYGPKGTVAGFREQVRRLLRCRVTAEWGEGATEVWRSMEVATAYSPFWDDTPGSTPVWGRTVTLGEAFFAALLRSPVPLDLRALHALRESPLGLDLYAWVSHRLSYAREPVAVSWDDLHAQFGAGYNTPHEFARKTKRELSRIATVWPALRYETPRGRLILWPSPPLVARAERLSACS